MQYAGMSTRVTRKVNMKRSFDYSYLLLCPFLALAIIPWLKYRFQYRLIIPFFLVWLIMSIRNATTVNSAKDKKTWFNPIAWMLAVVGLIFVYPLVGHGDWLSYSSAMSRVMSLFPLVIFIFAVRTKCYNELKFITFFSFVCMLVSAAMNINVLNAHPEAARNLTGILGASANYVAASEDVQGGIGGYAYIYGLGLVVVPVLCCIPHVSAKWKILFAVVAIVLLNCAIKAAFTTLMFGIFFSALLALMAVFKLSQRKFTLIATSSIILFLLVLTTPSIISFMATPISQVAEMVDRKEYSWRLHSIADSLSAGSDTDRSYASVRSRLYWTSFNTFLENPLFGIGNHVDGDYHIIGGHSTFFDTLASYGLFGLFFYIAFFISFHGYLRTAWTPLVKEWKVAHACFFYAFILISFINPIWFPEVMILYFLIIPGLAVFFTDFNKKAST